MLLEQKKYLFQSDDMSSSILLKWWHGLENDKGERGKLRRASGRLEVVFLPSYHNLLHQLQKEGLKVNREALATVAGLASHVREHSSSKSVAKQMAQPKAGSGARVSGLRFRRLLAAPQSDDIYPMLIRIIRMLDCHINLLDMANSAYWWNEYTRKKWAYDYYATSPKEL